MQSTSKDENEAEGDISSAEEGNPAVAVGKEQGSFADIDCDSSLTWGTLPEAPTCVPASSLQAITTNNIQPTENADTSSSIREKNVSSSASLVSVPSRTPSPAVAAPAAARSTDPSCNDRVMQPLKEQTSGSASVCSKKKLLVTPQQGQSSTLDVSVSKVKVYQAVCTAITGLGQGKEKLPPFGAVPSKSRKCKGRPRSNSVPNSPTGCNLLASATPALSFSAERKGTTPRAPKLCKAKAKTNAATRSSGIPLRRGKWTVEEETYVARVIQEFNSGYLKAPAGTTLRTYLSEKLHCDPMRISKKFVGDSCIGKRVFHPAVRCSNNALAIDKAQTELDSLERRWRKRLEMQQKESAEKAAASSTQIHARAPATRVVQHSSDALVVPTSGPNKTRQHQLAMLPIPTGAEGPSPKFVTQSASWLDRAQALLGRTPTDGREKQQIKEVETLIGLGSSLAPASSSTAASSSGNCSKRKVSEEDYAAASRGNTIAVGPSCSISTPTLPRGQQSFNPRDILPHPLLEHANDKRARRSQSMNSLSSLSSSEAKDAEALVDFLNSVRAAAASEGNNI